MTDTIPGCLRLGLSWFNWWVSFAPEFQYCYFCESSCWFVFLDLILIHMFLRQCTYELGIFHANQTTKCLRNQGRTKGECWSTLNKFKPPSSIIAGRPKAALLFWFIMIVLLSICLWSASIVATCIAAHSALCLAL